MTSKQTESAARSSGAVATSAAAGRTAGSVSDATRCAFCDSALPANRHVRFCPFCGLDQSQVPCVVCGEPLQPDWVFCIACGETAAPAGA